MIMVHDLFEMMNSNHTEPIDKVFLSIKEERLPEGVQCIGGKWFAVDRGGKINARFEVYQFLLQNASGERAYDFAVYSDQKLVFSFVWDSYEDCEVAYFDDDRGWQIDLSIIHMMLSLGY